MENFVFKNPLQKKVSRMNVEHYLGTDTASSDCSISDEDFNRIKGYKISTELDLYLFKTIYAEKQKLKELKDKDGENYELRGFEQPSKVGPVRAGNRNNVAVMPITTRNTSEADI